MDKEKIRPIYSELQGYLSQMPNHGFSSSEELWKRPNEAVDELINISGKQEYTRFKIATLNGDIGPFIRVESARTNLGGLISRLHAEYFFDEQPPFSGMPQTVINQNQSQNQNQSISIVLEIQEKIISEIPKHKEGSKERSFLEKVKSALPSIKTITDIISTILKIGSELNLSAQEIHNILPLS